MSAPKWKYNEEDIRLMNDKIDCLTAENERLRAIIAAARELDCWMIEEAERKIPPRNLPEKKPSN